MTKPKLAAKPIKKQEGRVWHTFALCGTYSKRELHQQQQRIKVALAEQAAVCLESFGFQIIE